MKNIVFLFALVAINTAPVIAQDSLAMKYGKTITPEELKEHLYILAGDKFEGERRVRRVQKIGG